MPKRLAVFVEGLTEQEFVTQLLLALAGKRGVTIEIQKQTHGHLSMVQIHTTAGAEFHVLLVNCCNDEQVKSQINDNHDSLSRSGYSLIIGLRDVYPHSHADIPKLEKYLSMGLPSTAPLIHMHLAVMEIEAWFLEELSHFARIDPGITVEMLASNGFDSHNTRATTLPNPASTLDQIYRSVSKRYTKKRTRIERTIHALSYDEIYVSVRSKAPSLDQFLSSLEKELF